MKKTHTNYTQTLPDFFLIISGVRQEEKIWELKVSNNIIVIIHKLYIVEHRNSEIPL